MELLGRVDDTPNPGQDVYHAICLKIAQINRGIVEGTEHRFVGKHLRRHDAPILKIKADNPVLGRLPFFIQRDCLEGVGQSSIVSSIIGHDDAELDGGASLDGLAGEPRRIVLVQEPSQHGAVASQHCRVELILAGTSDDNMDVSVLEVWKVGHTVVVDSVVVNVIVLNLWEEAFPFLFSVW